MPKFENGTTLLSVFPDSALNSQNFDLRIHQLLDLDTVDTFTQTLYLLG